MPRTKNSKPSAPDVWEVYALKYATHDRMAREKIRSQKREIPEGSEEWDLLHRRYYADELKKLGIDLTR